MAIWYNRGRCSQHYIFYLTNVTLVEVRAGNSHRYAQTPDLSEPEQPLNDTWLSTKVFMALHTYIFATKHGARAQLWT